MHTSVRNHSQDVPTTTQVRHRLLPVPQAIDWNPLLRMSTEQTWRDHQSRPTPSCHALDATHVLDRMAIGLRVLFLAGVMLGGVAHAQVHRCQSADGKVTYSDQPCAGAAVAPAPPASPAPKSRQAMDKFHQIAEENPKPPALREKKKECDAGNASACAEWDKMERAYYKSLTQKLEPVARNVKSHLTDECLAGDKGACSQACPSAQSTGERHELRFLAACAKALQRDSGSFWQVSKGAVRGNKPIELAYARRMPKNPVLDNELELLCFRKRASATEALLDSFYVKETYAVDTASGAVSGNVYVTSGQYGVARSNAPEPKFSSIDEWANRTCPR